ncbi:MAG: ATP-dependent DNA helicase RecG [Spirochaetaceae bacterium]
MTLWELSEPCSRIRGIGARMAEDLSSLGIRTVRDLLLHAPRGYEDRSTPVSVIEALRRDVPANCVLSAYRHEFIRGRNGRRTLKVLASDDSTALSLVCFGRDFLSSMLSPGTTFRFYGKVANRYGEVQSSSFDVEPCDRDERSFGTIVPVYPLSGRLSQGVLRKVIQEAIHGYAEHLEDTVPDHLKNELGTGSLCRSTASSIYQLHKPDSTQAAKEARLCLAAEELLLLQLRSHLDHASTQVSGARSGEELPRTLASKLIATLPFSLTADQVQVIEEIWRDCSSPAPMNRLLQGDVGSGKTLVAFISVAFQAEAGYQSVLMAPTELLARQHADNAARLLEPFGVRTALLHGGMKGSVREALLTALRTGDVDFLVGTHAVFTGSVDFRNLRLVIIDEQQRFGVSERSALRNKGLIPDTLFMTATPIPRTLALSLFGHLSVSTIKTMPEGRKPVITHLARLGNEAKVYRAVERELEAGRQAYFVYPLVDGTGSLTLKDATAMKDTLERDVFPGRRIGLVHSRVPENEKARTMAAFTRGELDILVATSVVEVGVDVPNATCMVVEHAERFGLSALHQLRGRVGRSSMQSYCFLVYSEGLTDAGKQRMQVMHRTTDGFEIAEEDLRIRGPGNVTGVEQSGYLRLAIADLAHDLELLQRCATLARRIAEVDRGLLAPEHARLRNALSEYRQSSRSE